MMASPSSEQLKILIAGAGIAGLAAALGLSREGHNVEVFEKSRFADEVGAALVLPPNVDGILKRFGMDPAKFGATREEWVTRYTPKGEVIETVDFSKLRKFFTPDEAATIHRVDLHEGLKSLVRAAGVTIHLSSTIRSIDTEKGLIILDDGEAIKGDVVIGSDGIHSKVRKEMFTDQDMTPKPFGVSTFRLLIPTAAIAADPLAKIFVERVGNLTVWDDQEGRRFITYPCRQNALINVVACFPESVAQPQPDEPNHKLKATMLEVFKNFSPHIKALMDLADKVMIWRLLDLPNLNNWSHDRVALIGDAAHPLLPYAAQGGAQAIEDAATLVVLLPRGTAASVVPSRLQLFYRCRQERVGFIQKFSRSMGLARPGDPVEPMMPYDEFNKVALRHDAWAWAEQALAFEQNKARWAGLKVMAAGRFVRKGVGIGMAVWREKGEAR